MTLTKAQRRTLFKILLSAALLIVLSILDGIGVLPDSRWLRLTLYLVAYLPVAWHVIVKAVRGLFGGQLLDENLLMLLATVGAFVIEEYPEAVFVMLFYQVGELFESIAVGKSRHSIAALMDIRPDTARVLRDGQEVCISPEDALVGELLIVRPGEKIALDGIVTEGESELDTRSLTGESMPRAITVGDTAMSGCININGRLAIRIIKPYEDSTVSKILELVESSSLAKSKAESAVTKFAHWYTPLVVITALLLAIIPSFITGEWQRWLHTALIFLVVSCPCALVISVPLSYFGGLGCASRHGILIKGSNRLEMLADTQTVVFDKTGTLTEGAFSISDILPNIGTKEELLSIATAAEQHSNHPIALSLMQAYHALAEKPSLPHVDAVEELPGYGVRVAINGESVLCGNAKLMEREGIAFKPFQADVTAVYVASKDKWLGTILLSDQIKAESREAIKALRSCGVKQTVMLTGDRAESADRVASALGLDRVISDLLPADKVSHLEALMQSREGTLVFVGDGVNDAPAMARADVGIAMGAIGSDAAIEAADVVLMDDRLEKIEKSIRIARFTRRIVLQNVWFAIGIKMLFLILGIFNMTNMWAATFADVGVAVIAILNAMRTLKQ